MCLSVCWSDTLAGGGGGGGGEGPLVAAAGTAGTGRRGRETFNFFLRKIPLAATAAMAAGRDKKMCKSFMAAVLLSASVKRFFVSRMRNFLISDMKEHQDQSFFF